MIILLSVSFLDRKFRKLKLDLLMFPLVGRIINAEVLNFKPFFLSKALVSLGFLSYPHLESISSWSNNEYTQN